ncbi:MAG: histidine phosphatase family protein [Candidatus Omnitrophica bacterium]|nr:histidine phosphatase family protein [Candidatus Omnitrophota bacterium]
MKEKFTEIFLIRHGRTEYNRNRQYCGSLDAPLNEEGMAQVKLLKPKAWRLKPDILFCSPLKRAEQTARILFPDEKIEFEPALRELNFGEWEGLQFEEIRRIYGDLYAKWINDPFSVTPPGAESLVCMQKRCMKFFNSVLEKHERKKIGIISHGGTIKMILLNVNNIERKRFWDVEVKNASLYRLKFKNKKLVASKAGEK